MKEGRGEAGSYTPILPEDIAATAMPAPREPDGYLRSRLDQFFADVQVRSPAAGAVRAMCCSAALASHHLQCSAQSCMPMRRKRSCAINAASQGFSALIWGTKSHRCEDAISSLPGWEEVHVADGGAVDASTSSVPQVSGTVISQYTTRMQPAGMRPI